MMPTISVRKGRVVLEMSDELSEARFVIKTPGTAERLAAALEGFAAGLRFSAKRAERKAVRR